MDSIRQLDEQFPHLRDVDLHPTAPPRKLSAKRFNAGPKVVYDDEFHRKQRERGKRAYWRRKSGVTLTREDRSKINQKGAIRGWAARKSG